MLLYGEGTLWKYYSIESPLKVTELRRNYLYEVLNDSFETSLNDKQFTRYSFE